MAKQRGRAYLIDGREGTVQRVVALGDTVPQADRNALAAARDAAKRDNAREPAPRWFAISWMAARRLRVAP